MSFNAVKYSTSSLVHSTLVGSVAFGWDGYDYGPSSASGWYNGVIPPSGGYAIYATSASQIVSVTIANDNAGLITIAEEFTGQHFVTPVQAETYLNANGYAVASTVYPNPDLIVNLNSGDPFSYPGSGSIWYDVPDGITGHNATLINNPLFTSSFDGIFHFDDTSYQYATIPNIGDLNQWTVEAWFRITKPLTGKVTSIVCNEFNLSSSLNFSIGTNKSPGSYNICVGFFDGNGWHNTNGFTPSLNTWYQVVGTYDGSTIKQYVNGAINSSFGYSGTPQSGGDIRLMRRWDSADNNLVNFVDGDLAIVKIYDDHLSTFQIQQNFNDNKARFGL